MQYFNSIDLSYYFLLLIYFTSVRTSALKYCEMIILTQSIKGTSVTSTSSKPDDVSLDMVGNNVIAHV